VWTLQFLVSLINDRGAFAATAASRPAGMNGEEGELEVSRRRGCGAQWKPIRERMSTIQLHRENESLYVREYFIGSSFEIFIFNSTHL